MLTTYYYLKLLLVVNIGCLGYCVNKIFYIHLLCVGHCVCLYKYSNKRLIRNRITSTILCKMAKIVSYKRSSNHMKRMNESQHKGKSLIRFLTESLSKELLINEIIPGIEYHGIMGDYIARFRVTSESDDIWKVDLCDNIFAENGNGQVFYSETIDSNQRKLFLDMCVPSNMDSQDQTPSYIFFNIILAFIRLYDPAKLYIRAKYFRPELEQNGRLKLTNLGYVVYNNDVANIQCDWVISRQHDWNKDKDWGGNEIWEGYNWDNVHLHETDDLVDITDSYKSYCEAQRKSKNPHNVYGYKKLVDSTQMWKETVKKYSGKMGKKRFSEIVRKISEDFNND